MRHNTDRRYRGKRLFRCPETDCFHGLRTGYECPVHGKVEKPLDISSYHTNKFAHERGVRSPQDVIIWGPWYETSAYLALAMQRATSGAKSIFSREEVLAIAGLHDSLNRYGGNWDEWDAKATAILLDGKPTPTNDARPLERTNMPYLNAPEIAHDDDPANEIDEDWGGTHVDDGPPEHALPDDVAENDDDTQGAVEEGEGPDPDDHGSAGGPAPQAPFVGSFVVGAQALKEFMEPGLALGNGELQLDLSADGITTATICPAHTSLAKVTLRATACHQFVPAFEGSVSVPVSGEELKKWLRTCAPGKKDVSVAFFVYYDPEAHHGELAAWASSGASAAFRLKGPPSGPVKIPAVDAPRTEVPLQDFLAIVKAAASAKSSYITLHSQGHTLRVESTGRDDSAFSQAIRGSTAMPAKMQANYSPDRLLEGLKTMKADQVALSFKTDYPVKIEWESAGGPGLYILAPTIIK